MVLRVLALSLAVVPGQLAASALPERTSSNQENLAALFSTEDYPDEAIKAEEQGTVAADLEIDPGGKVIRCTVTQSASPALDATTCTVIQQRASYPPFRDRQGRPTATSDKVRIRWVLPDQPDEKFTDAWFEVTALVPAAGHNQCTVRASMPMPSVSQDMCDQLVRTNATYHPQTIGRPFVMTIREERLVGEGIAPLLKGDGPARVIIRQTIDAEGYVSSCSLVPEPSTDVDDTPFYTCRLNAKYVPLQDDEPNRGDRTMTVTWLRSFSAAPAAAR